MAREASILVTLRDQYSPGVETMRSANSGFGRSLSEVEGKAKAYETKLSALVKKQGELQVELVDAKKALKEAETAYKATGDAADADALASAKEKYESLNMVMKDVTRASKDTQSALRDLEGQSDRMGKDPGGSSDSAKSSLLSSLGQAGAWSMVGDVASQWADAVVGSAFGRETANLISGALSGAASGAAIGSMIAPGIGTAVGAVAGGLLGAAGGAAQNFESQDEAFKSYVQETVEGRLDAMTESITSGSATASQRELDAIAFNKLLGDGVGDAYLSDLRTLAASTPMEYSDLTEMSRALATGFGGDPERMLALMEAIGNAGSAVGTDAGGMTTMAQALSRMQSSNKASLDYLNMFQERGVDVIGMLAAALGTDQGGIYDMISKGAISGTQAVEIIQSGLDQYAGAMDQMSQTYSGLTSTLADAQAEMDNAYGEGYNETRKQGLREEINWLSGESGAMIQEANRAMGAWQAELENLQEQYVREAVDAVLASDEYQAAMAQGTDEGYAEAGRMLMEAQVRGMNAYNASEGAQLMKQYQEELIDGVRDDTAVNTAYWDAGYQLGLEFDKGLGEAMGGNLADSVIGGLQNVGGSFLRKLFGGGSPGGYATGLARVPYNNFPALLHEGERVLTASEARSYSGGSGSVVFSGNQFIVRQESDIDAIAQALLGKLQEAKLAGAYG